MIVTAGQSFLHKRTAWGICPHLWLTADPDGKFYWQIELSKPLNASWPQRARHDWIMVQHSEDIDDTYSSTYILLGFPRPFRLYKMTFHVYTILNLQIMLLRSFHFFSTVIWLSRETSILMLWRGPWIDLGSNGIVLQESLESSSAPRIMTLLFATALEGELTCSMWVQGPTIHRACDQKIAASEALRRRILDFGAVLFE